MKQFAKKIVALTVTSALSLSLLNFSHAATYTVVDKSAAENLGYTYGGKLNNQGNMSVIGANAYNFPVQFSYLDSADFTNIVNLARNREDYYFGLGLIEDTANFEARAKAGNATANDLAWSKLYLQNINKSSGNPNFEYQIVADSAALYNLGDIEGSISEEICVFDTNFLGDLTCTNEITRSTVNVIEGFNNQGVMFGAASAPYLPINGPADSNGDSQVHWVREHGQRGFYTPDFGNTIIAVPPIETRYGGGISAVLDINDSGFAVGYSSYKVSTSGEEQVLNTKDNGCADPDVLAEIPAEVCVQKLQSGMYNIQAFKAKLSTTGVESSELLGLLIEPNKDDERAFTSQALAINNNGVAVGYAHGWNKGNVTAPTATERMTGSYAVMFKKDAAGNNVVFDFNQPHYDYRASSVIEFSRANDINDAGLAVGYVIDISNFVKKFFYVDTTAPNSEMAMITPAGFFKSSESIAYGVNSTGIIVGEAEIETHNESNDNPRRTTGFIYDTSSDVPTMTDINTLLSCDSAFSIIKANDINDAGQISATAIVKSVAYDALGNPVMDDSGNPKMVDVVRAVMLEPIPANENPVVDDCGVVEEKVERQGASLGWFGLLSLLTLIGLRERFIVN